MPASTAVARAYGEVTTRRREDQPMSFPQWDAGDPEGEDVRIASVGQLSVIFFANRVMRHVSVLDIVWLG